MQTQAINRHKILRMKTCYCFNIDGQAEYSIVHKFLLGIKKKITEHIFSLPKMEMSTQYFDNLCLNRSIMNLFEKYQYQHNGNGHY